MTGIGTQTYDISSKEEGGGKKEYFEKCREWKRWPLAVKSPRVGQKSESGPWEVRRKSVLSRTEGLCTGFHPSSQQYLLATYDVPDAVLEPENTVESRAYSPALCSSSASRG